MRAYWILPNRDQGDDLLASDGKTIVPLKEILDPTLRPRGFSHGIPSEILEKYDRVEEILFAQRFPGWGEGKQLFCVSSPAGLDATGRFVHLGLLLILQGNERPRFDLSCASLSERDQSYAKALLERLRSPRDPWARSVRELSDLPTVSRPASNVALNRSVVPFLSLYEAGREGVTRKSAFWRKSLTAAAILILIGVMGVISIRACERPSRAELLIGVTRWRFN